MRKQTTALETAAEGRLPGSRLFAYAAGIAGQNMHYGFVNGWLFYFINNILKINANVVGLITGISRLWDAVNDPIVGVLIDRHTFRQTGEKLRPIILLTAPLIGVLTPLMFKNWGFGTNGKIVYIILCYLIWDVIYSMQDVALWGMLAVCSPHSDQRARAAQWTAIGVTAGGAVAGLFLTVKDILVNNFGMRQETVFLLGALVFGLGGQLIALSAGRIKEQVRDEGKQKESFFEALFVLRHNRTMLLISLARILEYCKLTVPWQYFFESQVSYKVGSFEIGGGTAQLLYGGLSGAPGTFAMFAATKIVERVGGMKRILLIAQISSIVLRVISFFIGYRSIWQMLIVILIMGLQGIPANMVNIAHRSLMSDSIDEVEYVTGKRTEGITFSMQNFATKIGDAISLLISGRLLTLVQYDQYKAMTAQGALYMKWQWPMFMLGPIVGAVLYLMVIVFVRDDPARKKEVEQALKARRQALVREAQKELAES
ncbi:MAG: MFS transporter [Clostridia bacterium]|nr:MFS transporter [Clostridia bacterium]